MHKLSSNTQKFLEQNRDKKIVFTNGCFDIIHVGHVTYLAEARALGDVLIVGLNSDKSVKRLKGDSRPVNSEEDRKVVLKHLKSVDCVEIFDEDTPLELIKVIRPKILVKGGDWRPNDIVGYDIVTKDGGKVFSLGFVDGKSTTNIIQKIQEDR